jgi:hypothetical protein
MAAAATIPDPILLLVIDISLPRGRGQPSSSSATGCFNTRPTR